MRVTFEHAIPGLYAKLLLGRPCLILQGLLWLICQWGGQAAIPLLAQNAPLRSGPKPLESFEQREARLNTTVWKDEVLATKYERTFVKLADDLRNATNRIAILAAFDFDSMLAPTPEKYQNSLGLGITEQRFDDKARVALPQKGWAATLARLVQLGWTLDQSEWNHEKFIPPRDGTNAWSEFSFRIHGQRPPGATRFILKGNLEVDWDIAHPDQPYMRAKKLSVKSLSVTERAGAPGFSVHAVVTPNPPERNGEMVNMHPLVLSDINGDGNDDILMCGVNMVFINDGAAKFTSADLIADNVFRGSTDAGAVADFNSDGLPDFLTIAKQGSFTNKVVIYPGNGKVPFTQEPILAWPSGKVNAPSVMTVGDIDGDGDLDVWIAQYKPPYVGGQLPTPFYDSNDGYPSVLLLNDGHGKFEQATSGWGLGPKRFRRTLAASFVDLNGDDKLDLLAVNDYAGVDLYYHNGSGGFIDVSSKLYNPHLFGMGHCLADFDHDGVLDFLVIGMSVPTVRRLEFMKLVDPDFPDRNAKRVDMGYGNRVYTLRGDKWAKPAYGDELADTGWSWGTTAIDFDNNGDTDVYIANGHISGESAEDYDTHIWTHDVYLGTSREDPKLLYYFDKPFRGINTGKTSSNGYQHNVLFMDVGTNHFVNVAWLMGVSNEADCRAVASADLNKDGKLDLIITEGQWFGGPQTGRNRLVVYLNQLETKNHWIGARLNSQKPGVSPIGAKIWAKAGSRTYVGQIVTGDSYQSQRPTMVHFGLGKITKVDEIKVRWPNGKIQSLENPGIDRYHLLEP